MNNNTRVIFIDQLRGLAMIMIVMNHLIQFSYGVSHSFLSSLFEAVDLPLFFLISGYFLQKERNLPLRDLPGQLLKRARSYLVPLVSVGLLYCVLTGYDVHYFVLSGGGKLWFLYTLFWISGISLIVSVTPPTRSIEQRTKVSAHGRQMLYDVCKSGVLYIVIFALNYKFPDLSGFVPLGKIKTFYPYFVMGMLLKRYAVLEQLVRTNMWVYTLAVVTFVLGLYFYGIENRWVNMILIITTAIGGTVILWHYMGNLVSQNTCTRLLGMIGRHTLPIYIFHYFFIPDLSWLAPHLSWGNPFIIHLVACLVPCICIIPICILIEKMIERSQLLGFFLLGKKYNRS